MTTNRIRQLIIREKTYLNVCDGKEPQVKLLEEKGWTAETVAAFLILRYQVTADTLTVQWMDADAKKRAVEAGKIKGKIEKDQDGNDRATGSGLQRAGRRAAAVRNAGPRPFATDFSEITRVGGDRQPKSTDSGE